MPRFSAFAPFGLLRFSAKRSPAQHAYDAFVAGSVGAFSAAPGTPGEAEAYATAMAIGRVRATIERAALQHDEAHVTDMLPSVERNYRVVPGETETIAERRRTLVARKRVVRGSSLPNVTSALATLLGADFLGVRVMTTAEASTWPASPGAGPGVFTRYRSTSRLFRLTSHVLTLGIPVTFSYEPVVDALARLAYGEPAVVAPESNGAAERIVVLPSLTDLFASATFTKAQSAGTLLRAGTFPLWTSTKRHWFVMLSARALASVDVRRRVHALLQRLLRGTSTWSLVAKTSATTLGPFTVGVSPLGSTPIGTITV